MKIVVVYIAVTNGPLMAEYAARFAATYEMNPPLVEHETIVACNGGPLNLEASFLFLKTGAKFLPRVNDMGWDISAYQDVARKTDAELMVCFGETVHFHRPGWLLRLATERTRHGPGMYGCFASYLVRPHLNTSAFAIDPVYLRNYPRVFDHNSRYGFEHGYNSIVNTVAKKGGQTKLVTWDGAFDKSDWRKPRNILWRGGPIKLPCVVQPHRAIRRITGQHQTQVGARRGYDSGTKAGHAAKLGVKKLAIFWHGRISGGNPPVSPYARTIMAEQMDLLVTTGLYEAANLLVLGLNQNETADLENFVPPGAQVVWHGDNSQSELPTIDCLRRWLPGHEDWAVCYFHAKGARHGRDPLNIVWRRCMELAVILNWRKCVSDLENGCDSAGAHWLTREKYGEMVKTFFWGGNFWWAKGSFLSQLPAIPVQPTCRDDFFLAETWIGMGPCPKVKDYADHWPGLAPCSQRRKP